MRNLMRKQSLIVSILIFSAFILSACAGGGLFDLRFGEADLQSFVPIYLETARLNVRQIGDRMAVVPSPAYANGMYGRDAFYTALGLDDEQLFEQAYRWFEAAQNQDTGQIPTAVPLEPNDTSLTPQDDEITLIYLIWSGLLNRRGAAVDRERVDLALDFVSQHVEEHRYVSPPGQFRYWADCWRLDDAASITYNQGLYAIALQFLQVSKWGSLAVIFDHRAGSGLRHRAQPEVSYRHPPIGTCLASSREVTR